MTTTRPNRWVAFSKAFRVRPYTLWMSPDVYADFVKRIRVPFASSARSSWLAFLADHVPEGADVFVREAPLLKKGRLIIAGARQGAHVRTDLGGLLEVYDGLRLQESLR